MSDEELEQLARTGFDLSDEAHHTLEAEISRRGLSFTIASDPGLDVWEVSDLVTLRTFRDLPEALLAKGNLQSSGIESQLVDDNMIRLNWFISNLLGGIKLKVRAVGGHDPQWFASMSRALIWLIEVSLTAGTRARCPRHTSQGYLERG